MKGKVARVAQNLHVDSMDLRCYTSVTPDRTMKRWPLPTDMLPVDVFSALCRRQRAVGGGWTEMLHTDSSLAQVTMA